MRVAAALAAVGHRRMLPPPTSACLSLSPLLQATALATIGKFIIKKKVRRGGGGRLSEGLLIGLSWGALLWARLLPPARRAARPDQPAPIAPPALPSPSLLPLGRWARRRPSSAA